MSSDNAQIKVGSGAYGRDRLAGFDYASISPVFVTFDVITILLLAFFVGLLSPSSTDVPFDFPGPIGLGLLAAVGYALANHARGLYQPWRMVRTFDQVRAAAFTWILVMLFSATVIFCLKYGDLASRVTTGTFALCGLIALPLVRWRTAAWLRGALAGGSVRGRSAILVGEERELSRINPSHLLSRLGVSEVRRFSLPTSTRHGGGHTMAAMLGERGSLPEDENKILAAAVQFARQNRIGEVVLAMPWGDLDRLDAVRARLRALPLPVKLLPDESVNQLLNFPRVDFGPSVAIEVQRAPLSRFELTQKRALDLVVSSVALITLLPLFLIIAIAIRLDSKGPVIFRQRRNGFGGRQFTIFKFRSMTVMEDGGVVVQARRNDKRVTRVGRFLRSTSLDELPQVLNVLLGDMSIVGPRPHAIAHDDAYSKLIAGYAFRHHVKPGITGWAQVGGMRGETAQLEQMERRIEMDLWYINNWSIWLDIRIILKTFLEVFNKQVY